MFYSPSKPRPSAFLSTTSAIVTRSKQWIGRPWGYKELFGKTCSTWVTALAWMYNVPPEVRSSRQTSKWRIRRTLCSANIDPRRRRTFLLSQTSRTFIFYHTTNKDGFQSMVLKKVSITNKKKMERGLTLWSNTMMWTPSCSIIGRCGPTGWQTPWTRMIRSTLTIKSWWKHQPQAQKPS